MTFGETAERDPVDRERLGLAALARGGLLNLAGGVLSGFLGLALLVVVTRGLGPSRTGLFFEAIALFTILASVAEFGASTGFVRLVARNRTDTRQIEPLFAVALGPVMGVSVLLAAVLYMAAPELASLVVEEGSVAPMAEHIRALCWFLPAATGASVVLAGTRGFGGMLPFVVLDNVLKPGLRLLLVWLAVGGGIGIGIGIGPVTTAWALPLALTFPLGLAIFLTLVRRGRGAPDGSSVAVPAWRAAASSFWRFAAPRGIATVFQLSVLWLDVLLVGALRSTREAGIYAAVSRFVLVGALAIEAVRYAIAPQLSRLLARAEYGQAERLYQRGTWWLMVLSWPFYFAILLFAPVVLSLFGPGFGTGEAALMILSVAMLANTGTGNVTVVLLMGGKSSWNLANTLAALAVNIALNLLLIPALGVTGAAIAWSVSILVENGLALFQIQRLFGLQPFGSGYVRVMVAAGLSFAILGGAIRWLGGSSPGTLGVFALLTIPIYCVALWRSRGELELGFVADAVMRRGNKEAQPADTASGGAERGT